MTIQDPRFGPGRPPEPPPNRRGPVVAFVAIVLLAAALFWLITAVVRHNAVQNCIDSGRRDCVPLSSGP